MDPNTIITEEAELNQIFEERLKQLPEVVRRSIESADIQKHLRELADTRKLHLDQWQLLENEVMLTLLGFQPSEDLAKNIKSELDIDEATATSLAEEISRVIFEPIRQELERQLEHPDAQAATVSNIESARTQMLTQAADEAAPPAAAPPATPPAAPSSPLTTLPAVSSPEVASITPIETPVTALAEPVPITPVASQPAVLPATPPPPPPIQKAARASLATEYTAAPSHERKAIEGDPYREQIQ